MKHLVILDTLTVREVLAAFLACKWLFATVRSLMARQIAGVREPLWTERAWEWTFSSVHTLVSAQRTCIVKWLSARHTHVPFLASMHSVVCSKAAEMGEATTARHADVTSFTDMDALVLAPVARVFEASSTKAAHVRRSRWVHGTVLIQAAGVRKTFPTIGTRVRHLPSMVTHVIRQGWQSRKRLLTLYASVTFFGCSAFCRDLLWCDLTISNILRQLLGRLASYPRDNHCQTFLCFTHFCWLLIACKVIFQHACYWCLRVCFTVVQIANIFRFIWYLTTHSQINAKLYLKSTQIQL